MDVYAEMAVYEETTLVFSCALESYLFVNHHEMPSIEEVEVPFELFLVILVVADVGLQ